MIHTPLEPYGISHFQRASENVLKACLPALDQKLFLNS